MTLTPIQISIISAFFAFAALLVSFIALWKMHFANFNVLSAVGNLRHRVYPIKSDNDKWYMVSFDIPISFTNSGAKPGLLTGLRLKLHYPKLPIPNNHEYIYPNFEIDPKRSNEITKERFTWISELVHSHWMPFTILPKATILKHFFFETRWDNPVIQEKILCNLEVETDHKSNWFKVCEWNLCLSPKCWSELADVGRSMSYSHDANSHHWFFTYPEDLHKYTGSNDPLPTNGYEASPSYLDYPDEKSK